MKEKNQKLLTHYAMVVLISCSVAQAALLMLTDTYSQMLFYLTGPMLGITLLLIMDTYTSKAPTNHEACRQCHQPLTHTFCLSCGAYPKTTQG